MSKLLTHVDTLGGPETQVGEWGYKPWSDPDKRAVIGAELSDFVDRYGPHYTVDGQPPNLFYFWDAIVDLRFSVMTELGEKPEHLRKVVCVSIVAHNERLLIEDQAASRIMERFHPTDARWKDDKVAAHGVSGWFIGFDRLYVSDWLGERFPPEFFRNRSGDLVPRGMFDLQCFYDQGTKFCTSVSLAIGGMMIDDVRAGQPG